MPADWGRASASALLSGSSAPPCSKSCRTRSKVIGRRGNQSDIQQSIDQLTRKLDSLGGEGDGVWPCCGPRVRKLPTISKIQQIVTHSAWPQRDRISMIAAMETNLTPEQETDLRRFGRRLSDLRKARGWSQERLALESGLARSYLGGVERGQRNIAVLNILRLARTLARARRAVQTLKRTAPIHFLRAASGDF